MFSYHINHINGSLVKRHNDEKTTYHTDMLIAYMVIGNIMIAIDFEPIENVSIVYDKQDCEVNAAKRLLRRIKRNFKRLQICISANVLYFNEPMIKLIESLHWKYIFTYKQGGIKEVDEYRDNVFNMIGYTKKNEGEKTIEYFCCAINLRISEGNYKKMLEICRRRWEIENKGFNELKNHRNHMGTCL